MKSITLYYSKTWWFSALFMQDNIYCNAVIKALLNKGMSVQEKVSGKQGALFQWNKSLNSSLKPPGRKKSVIQQEILHGYMKFIISFFNKISDLEENPPVLLSSMLPFFFFLWISALLKGHYSQNVKDNVLKHCNFCIFQGRL